MGEGEPKEGEVQDLYLRGEGYDSEGKAIDFDEKIVWAGHGSGRGELRWQLTVYESGNFKLGELGGGDGMNAPDDKINCDRKGIFEENGEEGWFGGADQWEKAVNSIKFKLTNCGNAGGRRRCDIEISEVKNLLIKRY
ncbi:hypothetical protein DNK47_00800 [Mycoplasma wenyonii]|uniref:Uncharacterized protein n=1 Tax=Mycoplasma wenyonii TaxID=65123 RepID=A0A328PJ77_9MOLU|nr:hypothetical protein [Mycoplasma wenyonii]RAO95153.1 hypothetical protein DNK47_00800 [Mycoplasma wenyonii]